MTLKKHYRNAVLYPSIFVFVFSIIYSIIDNYDYESEWFTAESGITISIIASIIYSIFICTLSLTIFLNKYDRVNESIIWNILTWFLLPFGCIAFILIHEVKHRIKYEYGFGEDFIYILIFTVPYIIGLSVSFLKYRLEKLPPTKKVH